MKKILGISLVLLSVIAYSNTSFAGSAGRADAEYGYQRGFDIDRYMQSMEAGTDLWAIP